MIEIYIDNEKCKVENINPYIWRVVTDMFTFAVPGSRFSTAYRSGRWDGNKCFFDRNVLLTGLLPLLINKLEEYKEPYKLIDTRENVITLEQIPENFKVGTKILRNYQIDAANSIINNTCGSTPYLRGILHMATNSGKTVTAEAIMNKILKVISEDEKILFIVPTKELLFQTKQTFEKDFPNLDIGLIGAGTWKEGIITIALVPTLSKNIKEKKFKTFSKDIKAIIVDEVQHAASDSYQKVLKHFSNADIRIGLTGTLPEEDIKRHQVLGATGTPTIRISNDFLIKQEASAKPTCYFIEIREPNLGRIYDYQEEYYDGIVNNPVRNHAIACIVKQEVKHNKNNVLILVEHTEHGEILQELLQGCGTVELTHGSKTTKKRQSIIADLKEDRLNVLIATSVLDEGVDTDNINVIIYARGQKSPRKLLQGLGRGLRKKSDGSGLRFYDFLDYTGKDLKKHTLERFLVLKEEGFDIKKISIDEINRVGDNIEKNN